MQTGAPDVSPEVVAAITAALTVVVERPFVITAIRPEHGAAGALPSMWAKAGLLEQQLLRRNFIARTR